MINRFLASDVVWRIGWMLLHSLWQILFVGGIVFLALAVLSRRSPRVRYRIACLGMPLMFVPLVVTFFTLPARPAETASPPPGVLPAAAGESHRPVVDHRNSEATGAVDADETLPGTAARTPVASEGDVGSPASDVGVAGAASASANAWFACAVSAWMIGVGLLSCWNVGGWLLVQRLRTRAAIPASAALERRLAALARRMEISRPVRVLQSLLVDAPLMIGWLRPVVLLPLSLVTSLTADELDAVLAHELSHIRRHDYLINLLQALAETLMFYHPVVWLLSRRIRVEREFCCDDLAVSICRDRVCYARVLAAIAERRLNPSFAMSLTGRKHGMTLQRIRRLLTGSGSGQRPWLTGILSLVSLAVVFAGITLSRAGESDSPKNPAAATPAQNRSAAARPAEATPSVGKAPPAPFGKAVNGLQTRVSSTGTRFRVGEPVSLLLEVRNVGTVAAEYTEPHIKYIGLTVTDEQGRKVRFLRGPAQLPSTTHTIKPGRTDKRGEIDLASQFYMRKPGRYTVRFDSHDLPASNTLTLTIVPGLPENDDGDPVGRLLPLATGRRILIANPNYRGRVQPGRRYEMVEGARFLYLHSPQGGTIRDLSFAWVWLTTKQAGKARPEAKVSRFTPESEYLGKVGRWHVYLHVDAKMGKRWPKAKQEILRALKSPPARPAAPKSSSDNVQRRGANQLKATVTSGGGLRLAIDPGLSRRLTSLSLNLLESCTYEATETLAVAPKRIRALTLPHLRIRFAAPEAAASQFGQADRTGKRTIAVKELLIPVSPSSRPDYIFARNGTKWRAFAKYRFPAIDALQKAIAGGPLPAALKWGKTVDGMQIRLRPESRQWTTGQTPTFSLDIRNRSKRAAQYIAHRAFIEVEYDGQWHQWGPGSVYSGPATELPPGKERRDIMRVELKHGDKTGWVSRKEQKPMTLVAGKHTVRIALMVVSAPSRKGGIRLVSNPVAVTVTRQGAARPKKPKKQ